MQRLFTIKPQKSVTVSHMYIDVDVFIDHSVESSLIANLVLSLADTDKFHSTLFPLFGRSIDQEIVVHTSKHCPCSPALVLL